MSREIYVFFKPKQKCRARPNRSTPVGRIYFDIFIRQIAGPDRGNGFALAKINADMYFSLLKGEGGITICVLTLAQAFFHQLDLADEDISFCLVHLDTRVSKGSHDPAPIRILSEERCFHEA